MSKQRCQRIGCDAFFTDENNPEGGCRYHAGPPVFHDGNKEWSCCKAKSHDFGMFMDLPGCATGKHTLEKPPKPVAAAKAEPALAPIPVDDPRAACPRCKQGFFCQEHAAIPGAPPGAAAPPPPPPPVVEQPVKKAPVRPAEPVDPDAEQTCRHKGCGLKYRERDNTDEACSYHPGPPVFHDRKKGWGCCDKHAWSFDEFMEIPTCSKGRHDAFAE
mmetsp:Transcript_45879/g.146468  ORF Transcript_45879/g.146468 Transcript_45879/m.146468 type:complete len:216 (+) Transcript_45879:133-780(+)